MGFHSYNQAWFKSDGLTAANPGAKGILGYSAYNRLSTAWPMLKETNVLDFTSSGTYQLYNSETASIGDKTAVVRIPLSSLIKNDISFVNGYTNYHTHYYVEFVQRRPNTDAGGLYNYVVIRSAPNHRLKPSMDTILLAALSTDDTTYGATFSDEVRGISITLKNIDANGAVIDISVPSDYAPYRKANNCYFSFVADKKYVVTANGNKACRAVGYDDALSVGYYNGTACLTTFYDGNVHAVSAPDVEYLHCTSTPEWVKASDSTMESAFDLLGRIDIWGIFDSWGKYENLLCKTTFEGVEYFGRGNMEYCFHCYNGMPRRVENSDASTKYLKWLSL